MRQHLQFCMFCVMDNMSVMYCMSNSATEGTPDMKEKKIRQFSKKMQLWHFRNDAPNKVQ